MRQTLRKFREPNLKSVSPRHSDTKTVYSEYSEMKTKSVTGGHSETKGIRIHYDQCDFINTTEFFKWRINDCYR